MLLPGSSNNLKDYKPIRLLRDDTVKNTISKIVTLQEDIATNKRHFSIECLHFNFY